MSVKAVWEDMGYVHRLHAVRHACHCKWLLLEGVSGKVS